MAVKLARLIFAIFTLAHRRVVASFTGRKLVLFQPPEAHVDVFEYEGQQEEQIGSGVEHRTTCLHEIVQRV